MQNKYCNITFYLLIITFVTLCGMGTVKRYQSDAYFNIARNHIPKYADTNDKQSLKIIQYCYWQAIKNNPLEYEHYARRLNGQYLKRISRGK